MKKALIHICPCCNGKIKAGINHRKFKEHVRKCEQGLGREKGKSHPMIRVDDGRRRR